MVEEALDDQPHALVRKDIVSVGVLRQMLPRDGLPHFSDQGLANILREDGYIYAGRHVIDGERHNLWALEGVTDVLAKARTRVEFL